MDRWRTVELDSRWRIAPRPGSPWAAGHAVSGAVTTITVGQGLDVGELAQAVAEVSAPPAVQRQVGHIESVQSAGDSALRGLIVHDDPVVQRALGVIMERCGFRVMGVTSYPTDSLPAARATRPDAVVLDLALSGDLGLQIIPKFLAVSPACMVVVLSPFTALRKQAQELGAMGLVDPRDLRHVEDWLLLGTDPEHPCRGHG